MAAGFWGTSIENLKTSIEIEKTIIESLKTSIKVGKTSIEIVGNTDKDFGLWFLPEQKAGWVLGGLRFSEGLFQSDFDLFQRFFIERGPTMKVLELENVTRRRDGKTVLNKVNWQVEKGEHWVLYGLNGAGKTSLLDLINAYIFPTEGKVSVLGLEFGKTYLSEKLRKQIGFVSSSLQQKISPYDNAYEVVLSGAYASIGLYEETTEAIDRKGVEILKELGCLEYANRTYETLSHGERQRVLIGRALMAEPALLVLDEPANGLDFIAREMLLETIEGIAKKPDAPTIIYVTHHIEEILPVFTKTLLLKDGAVFASGHTNELVTSEGLSAFFGMPVEVGWNQGRPLLSKVKRKSR